MTKIYTHPFRDGIKAMLENHFHPDVVDRFNLILERQLYQDSKEVVDMFHNDKVILEVHYRNTDDTAEYICDLYGWDSKANTEKRLLTYITDAYKAGRIGKDWIEKGNRIGKIISEAKYETPLTLEEILEKEKEKKLH